MLSRVSNRVRRPSLQDTTIPPPRIQLEVVDCAPDLLRWGDFSTPFPHVALGGYKKYYASSIPQVVEGPIYCPPLSREPNPYPSREIPATSLLFFISPPITRPLTIIHEASVESMTPQKPQNLSIRTSLRRKRRRLLRTPSIERDFPIHTRHFLASSSSGDETTTSSSSIDRTQSQRSAHSHSDSTHSHSSVQSDLSNHSESMSSECSNHSDFPITPSTSVDSGDEGYVLVHRQLEKEGPYETQKRPDSISSFSTARTNLSDSDT